MIQSVDIAVIGSGFGGLSTTLELANNGADVVMFEALKYPGGCASTFTRRGHRFESGVTLFSGFGKGQLFADWMERYALPVTFQAIDPLVRLRTAEFSLDISSSREALVSSLCALPDAPVAAIERFFAKQKRVADILWELFDDPELLPPFGAKRLLQHVTRSSKYVELLPLVGRPLGAVLRDFGLGDFRPIWTYLNAICQITIQTDADSAETPFAMATMDYYFRGTGHIQGGVGELAWALARAAKARGAKLSMADPVRQLTREKDGWKITSRHGEWFAKQVVANMLPQGVRRLTGETNGRLEALTDAVKSGWGAAMLYLTVQNDALPEHAFHLELVGDSAEPFLEGNHIFCSVSGADEDRGGTLRTATVSTHIPMQTLLQKSADERGIYVQEVQDRMRRTLAERAPEIANFVDLEMTGSPRTFERFTLRDHGYVGGIPRRAGLSNYNHFWPREILPNLYLVGDSVFPGQSTLATAIGGVKLAQHLLNR